MKIIWFGYDYFAHCLEEALNRGHELVALCTFETDNVWNFRREVESMAIAAGASVSLARLSTRELQDLVERTGADVIVSAGYPYRIPIVSEIPMLNVHPSLLPDGRGPWPIPYYLLGRAEISGVSVHRLTEKMDEGPVLARRSVSVQSGDDYDELSVKLKRVAAEVLSGVLSDLDAYLEQAVDQVGGTYLAFPTDEVQTIDWACSWEKVVEKVKAFGSCEVSASFGGKQWLVSRAYGWAAEHGLEFGTMVSKSMETPIVAVRNGYVALLRFREDVGDV